MTTVLLQQKGHSVVEFRTMQRLMHIKSWTSHPYVVRDEQIKKLVFGSFTERRVFCPLSVDKIVVYPGEGRTWGPETLSHTVYRTTPVGLSVVFVSG